jgi:hypothetical protein
MQLRNPFLELPVGLCMHACVVVANREKLEAAASLHQPCAIDRWIETFRIVGHTVNCQLQRWRARPRSSLLQGMQASAL